MRTRRLQNKLAQNRFSLPFVIIYATLLWLSLGLVEQRLWVPFGILAVSTYLMVEINNKHTLIRVYGRMVSCSFLVLNTLACESLTQTEPLIVQLCVIAFLTSMFPCYQNKHSMGMTCIGFCFIGIASLFFVQILLFLPVLWLLMAINLLNFSGKVFWASIIGTAIPYWFTTTYLILSNQPAFIINHFERLADFSPLFQYQDVTLHQTLTLGFIALLSIIGAIHFVRTSYNDKIRVRMIYEMLISLNFYTLGFLLLQPQHYDYLIRLLIISTSPLIAHYITLTSTRLTNISFILILILSILLTTYNLWMP